MKKKVGDKITAIDSETGNIILDTEIKKIAKFRTAGGFEPAIMLVQHQNGKKDLYFPYWKKTKKGKQGFANRPPMFDESIFLRLLKDAINQGFFTKGFLKKLNYELEITLRR